MSLRFLPLLVLLFSIQGCGFKLKKKKKTVSSEPVIQVFIKGDPKVIIEGTSRNTTSFITTDNIKKFNNFQSAGIILYTEKEYYKLSTTKQAIESGNEASDGQEFYTTPSIYNFHSLGNNQYQLQDSKNLIHFTFTKKSNSNELELSEIQNNEGVKITTTPLHYSISEDQAKISILASGYNSITGNILISIFLYRPAIFEFNQREQVIDSKYFYLAGPGIKSAWKLDENKKIHIDVCPEVVRGFQNQYADIENSIRKWEKPFIQKNKKFTLNIRYPNQCKPFSDVNQHAVYWVNQYLTYPAAKDIINPAVTFSMYSKQTARILSSDILFFESEINKMASNNHIETIRSYTQKTLSHEIGHFLGLDHNFEDNSSIMSYKDVDELGNYDEDAVYELYQDQLMDTDKGDYLSSKAIPPTVQDINGNYL